MKKPVFKLFFAWLLLTSVMLTSCNEAAKPEPPAAPEVATKPEPPTKATPTAPTTPTAPVAQATDLKYRLFFKGIDFEGEKGTVNEKENFQKEKSYMSCFDSEHFEKFQIDGNAENLSLTITKDGQSVFSMDKISVVGSKIFTKKDFSLNGDGGIGYIVTIKQANTVLFEGKVDSQGCM